MVNAVIQYTPYQGGNTVFAKMDDYEFNAIIEDLVTMLACLNDNALTLMKHPEHSWFWNKNKYFGEGQKGRTQAPIEFLGGLVLKSYQRNHEAGKGDFSVFQLKRINTLLKRIGLPTWKFQELPPVERELMEPITVENKFNTSEDVKNFIEEKKREWGYED